MTTLTRVLIGLSKMFDGEMLNLWHGLVGLIVESKGAMKWTLITVTLDTCKWCEILKDRTLDGKTKCQNEILSVRLWNYVGNYRSWRGAVENDHVSCRWNWYREVIKVPFHSIETFWVFLLWSEFAHNSLKGMGSEMDIWSIYDCDVKLWLKLFNFHEVHWFDECWF